MPTAAMPEDQGAIRLAQSDGCTVWQLSNETGEGTMTTYEVFPGVLLSFNDFHMEYYDSRYVADRQLFAIDHCREGRMEYAAGENRLAYTAAGDVKPDLRRQHTGRFLFPSGHYHGLTIAFDRAVAAQSLPQEMHCFPLTPESVIARFSLGEYPRVLHGAQRLEHIFGELYQVPEKIRIPYFQIKILELLLYLDAMELPQKESEPPYFYKTQVEKVKAIRRFLLDHIAESIPQEELARRFGLSMTAMTCASLPVTACFPTFPWCFRTSICSTTPSAPTSCSAGRMPHRRK